MWLLVLPCLLASGLGADHYYWYKNAVVYQIYPRSFQDSDGDGIGDLRGIIEHVPYLQSLGIAAVWLSPIYPSPNADFGYDISDMDGVNPEYGTLKDFKDLLDELKARGIRVIMDFVPNHTSTKHPWFIASEARNDTHEKYSDFYIWKDPSGFDSQKNPLPPNNWLSVMGTGSAWQWSDKRQQFYLHTFLVEQADLNYDNPRVIQNMLDVLKVWMRRGVSGFRMDAVSWIYDNLDCGNEPASPHPNRDDPNDYNNLIHNCTQDQPKTFDIIKQFRRTIDHFEDYLGHKEAKLMMVESYSDLDTVVKYYGDKGSPGATFPFNFNFITIANQESSTAVWGTIMENWLNLIKEGKWPNWVIGNHDQHRAASRFSNEWVDLLHILTMTLRGTVVTYNGEEIGLEDSSVRFDEGRDLQGLRAGPSGFQRMSRDFQRGPIPWNNTFNGGFTSGKPWLPLSTSYWSRNIGAESSDKSPSHLSVYKTLVNLRMDKTLADGECLVQTSEEGLIIITRYLQDNPTIISVVNIGDYDITADMNRYRHSLPSTLQVIVGSFNFPTRSSRVNATELHLPPKTGVVLRTYSN